MPEDTQNESVEIKPADISKRKRNCCCWSIFVVVALVLFIYIGITSLLGPRRAAWMSRAKRTLRSMSCAQLNYQETNENGKYGSFQDLVRAGEIREGYTLGNMIENYSMTWEVNFSTAASEEFPTSTVSTFQIIAYPRDTRPGYLFTFAITEDQIVRVYSPDDKDFSDIRTWDPIL